MGKTKKQRKKTDNKVPRKRKGTQKKNSWDPNYLSDAQPGCHVVWHSAPWMVGIEPFDRAAMGLGPADPVPDLSIDPDSLLLSVLNPSPQERTFFITVEHPLLTEQGSILRPGSYRDGDGEWHSDCCVTLVVVAPPKCVMDLAYVDLPGGGDELHNVRVHSDVKPLVAHPSPAAFDASKHVYPFPLGSNRGGGTPTDTKADVDGDAGLAAQLGFAKRAVKRILPGINRPPLSTLAEATTATAASTRKPVLDEAAAAALAEKRARRRERRIEKLRAKQQRREDAVRAQEEERLHREEEEKQWRASHEQKRQSRAHRVRDAFRYSIDHLLAMAPSSSSRGPGDDDDTGPGSQSIVPDTDATAAATTAAAGGGDETADSDADKQQKNLLDFGNSAVADDGAEQPTGAFSFGFSLDGGDGGGDGDSIDGNAALDESPNTATTTTTTNAATAAAADANATAPLLTNPQQAVVTHVVRGRAKVEKQQQEQQEEEERKEADERFLCTQGMGGCFTHFYAGTLHAVDFACPVGTPVLSVGEGTVLDVRTQHRVGGIKITNLFEWNSITVQLDNGAVAEYVHVQTDSALVQKGDRVKAGQVLCLSGDVGFCPSPHLHFQMHESTDDDAPTIKFAFRDGHGGHYFPVAGRYYSRLGPCSPPFTTKDTSSVSSKSEPAPY